MLTGIVLGLCAATCQSFSYLLSRRFTLRHRGSTLSLTIAGHVVMGIISLVSLPFLWPAEAPALRDYAADLAQASGAYLGAQFLLFSVVRHVEASRVSPLLGLKVFVLASISALLYDTHIYPIQWGAVGMSVAAVFLLGRSGKKVSLLVFGLVMATVTGYSFSDIGIRALVARFEFLGIFRASLIAVTAVYAVCGVMVLPFCLMERLRNREVWRDAFPWAITWIVAMAFLFATFAHIGVVFGGIVQATRGIISVGIGAVIARAGHSHLEQAVSRTQFLNRLGAAFLMTAAIVVFYLAGSGN